MPPQSPEIATRASGLAGQPSGSSIWTAYTEPGTSVAREPDEVRITAAASSAVFRAYADLHSESMRPVAATELAAELVVAGDGYPVGGISWAHDTAEGQEDDDDCDLIIDSGYLHAVRMRAFEERVALCSPTCPAYDTAARRSHLSIDRLRLRRRTRHDGCVGEPDGVGGLPALESWFRWQA